MITNETLHSLIIIQNGIVSVLMYKCECLWNKRGGGDGAGGNESNKYLGNISLNVK